MLDMHHPQMRRWCANQDIKSYVPFYLVYANSRATLARAMRWTPSNPSSTITTSFPQVIIIIRHVPLYSQGVVDGPICLEIDAAEETQKEKFQREKGKKRS